MKYIKKISLLDYMSGDMLSLCPVNGLELHKTAGINFILCVN